MHVLIMQASYIYLWWFLIKWRIIFNYTNYKSKVIILIIRVCNWRTGWYAKLFCKTWCRSILMIVENENSCSFTIHGLHCWIDIIGMISNHLRFWNIGDLTWYLWLKSLHLHLSLFADDIVLVDETAGVCQCEVRNQEENTRVKRF